MVSVGERPMSWGLIILLLIFVPPVGILFLINRLAVDKTATIRSGRTITIISYVLMGIGALQFLNGLYGRPGMLVTAILWGSGGIWLNRIAQRTTLTGERYKKYITLVVNQNYTSIDKIASAVGVSYEDAAQDLQKMINSGYFTGAYINAAQREIVLARTAPSQAFQAAAAQTQERVVTCGSCGANNRVSGQFGECEYCGSPLQ